jgi:hypothetical protein
MAQSNPNGLKVKVGSQLGTPELAVLVIVSDAGNFETNYTNSDSNYAKAVRGLQTMAELYLIGKPDGSRFTVLANANTLPQDDGESAADRGANNTLTDVLNAGGGFTDIVVWNAELDGDNLSYD